MLSVKGDNLFSWSGDDNFIVDDSEMSHYEVTFPFPFFLFIIQT